MNLTEEQIRVVAANWVVSAGHLYIVPGDEDWFRILRVIEGEIAEWAASNGAVYSVEDGGLWPAEAVPCFWGDDATAAGLPATARAKWRNKTLHVTPTLNGKFALNRIHKNEFQAWIPGKFYPRIDPMQVVRFESESEAWVAACCAPVVKR